MEAISLFVTPHPVLRDAIERLVDERAISFEPVKFDSGDYLFREGDATRQTYFIKRGMVRLFSNSADGYSKTVFFYREGSLLGFQKLQRVEKEWPSILNAKAATPVSAYAMDAQEFVDCLKHDGEVCYAMAQYMFEQLALQTRESVNTSIYPILQRFSGLLLMLAKEFGTTQAPVLIPFSNEELAEMLGVHTNSVSNAIMALKKADCIERQRSALLIVDLEKLRFAAENLVSLDE